MVMSVFQRLFKDEITDWVTLGETATIIRSILPINSLLLISSKDSKALSIILLSVALTKVV